MARNNFESCLQEILRHEGGFSDVRSDPGNWTGGRVGAGLLKGTKYGISAAAYPTIDIKNITVEFAASQYKNKYWNRVKGDQLPDGIDLVAFDPAVNSGVSRGSRWLQSALGVTQDGKIGPQTVLAAQTATDGVAVIKRACAARMGFLRGLTSLWSTYSRGWTRRVASVEATAVAMYTRSAVAVRQERKKASTTAKAQATGAASSAAGGAGGASLDGLPDLAAYGLIALAVVVAVVLISKSRTNAARATAYKQKEAKA